MNSIPNDCGLLVVGHGSREAAGIEEFLAAFEQLRKVAGSAPLEPCFLEFAEPTIAEAFRRLANRGVREVVVVPVLLFAAGHAKRDIPEAVARAAAETPHITVRQAAHLGLSPRLLQLSERRLGEALASASLIGREQAKSAPPLVVLVGRGSLDPSATEEMLAYAKALERQLHESARQGEGPDIHRVEVAFVAMAEPRLTDVLEAAGRRGERCIVVQPHLLFGGVLLDRIRQTVTDFAGRFPSPRWVAAAHLGPDPLVAAALLSGAQAARESPGNAFLGWPSGGSSSC